MFDVGDMSIINEEIDTEFQDLFAQISSETTFDEYIDCDAEETTSEPAFDARHVDWWVTRMPRKKQSAIRRYCFNQ